jgi:D-inositol-3-phosphate glycosyltransferase
VAAAPSQPGLLVPGHRAEQWADALGAVVRSPGRRDELGSGAVQHAQMFSWERTADALLATYAEAAAEYAERQGLVVRPTIPAG